MTGVTVTAKAYDSTTTATLNTNNATLVGVFSGDTVTLSTSGKTGMFASKNVGTGITVTVAGLTISGAQAGDYSLTQPTTTGNITPALLSITGVTGVNKVYDGTNTATLNTGSAALGGVFSGDTVTLIKTGAQGSFATKNVGSNISVSISGFTLGGAQAGNYSVTQPSTSANINPAGLTVSGLKANNKVYDATATAVLNTSSATLVGLFNGDAVTLNAAGATAFFASKNVGTNITVTVMGLTLSGAQNADYTLTQPTTTGNIAPATLTVAGITANNKVYDATTKATLTVEATAFAGVFLGDSVMLVTSGMTGTFAGKDVANNIPVTVAGLTLGGAQGNDYTLTQPTSAASITPATLTVTGIAANNKVYDSTTTATLNTDNAILASVFNGDSVAVAGNGAVGLFASKDAANNIPLTVSGLTLTGAQAADYTLTQSTSSANITPAPLTVSDVTANDKTYDTTTAATLNIGSAILGSVFTGDTVTLSGGTGIYASKDVGNDIPVTGTNLGAGRPSGERLYPDPTHDHGKHHPRAARDDGDQRKQQDI